MTITKCDICKKQIKRDSHKVSAGLGWFARHELCMDCGAPLVKFLLNKKLINKSDLEKLKQ